MNKEQIHKYILQSLLHPKRLPLTVLLNDLSPGEFFLIASFLTYEDEHQGKHITVNELASNLDVTVPAVSRSLKKLEEKGLISRVTDKDCRRNTFVVISESGKELFDENKDTISCILDSIIQELSVEEIKAAIEFQEKLQHIMDRECTRYLKQKIDMGKDE